MEVDASSEDIGAGKSFEGKLSTVCTAANGLHTEYGPDDEELYELGMHPEQYRDFKSGIANEGVLCRSDND